MSAHGSAREESKLDVRGNERFPGWAVDAHRSLLAFGGTLATGHVAPRRM